MARKGVKMGNKGISRARLKEDIKKGILFQQNSIKCKNCGHAMLLGRKDRRICSWCGNYIYKDDKTEFEYKKKEKMLKENKI